MRVKIAFKGWTDKNGKSVDATLDDGRVAQQHEADKLKIKLKAKKLTPRYERMG